jgi:hypothetical protein
VRNIAHIITGTLLTGGDLILQQINAFFQTLTAALTFAGDVIKQPSIFRAGALTLAATLQSVSVHILTANLVLAGVISKSIARTLTGVLQTVSTFVATRILYHRKGTFDLQSSLSHTMDLLNANAGTLDITTSLAHTMDL